MSARESRSCNRYINLPQLQFTDEHDESVVKDSTVPEEMEAPSIAVAAKDRKNKKNTESIECCILVRV